MKYICGRCEYKCSSNRDLNKHIKYVHDKLKDVHCDMWCDYKCSERVNLKNISNIFINLHCDVMYM